MKRTIKVLAFLICFIFIFYNVCNILSFKYSDGILGMEGIYELEDNSVDVLFLGSSHAFENFNTGVLYDSYGIASYIAAGSVQPYWNTYYYLQETLKKQTPKVVVLEAYGSMREGEYAENSCIIKNNLGIRDLDTLYQSLKVSSSPGDFKNYLFQYRLWHSRYGELDPSDYQKFYQTPYYKYFKGFGLNPYTTECSQPQMDNIDQEIPMSEKTELYYRKIIELCQTEEIPLAIVVAPYMLSPQEQMKYNYAKKIADEYDVEFINYNSTEGYNRLSLDFAKDFGDVSHLNFRGNVKFTNAVAQDVLSKYQIPDRRGDARYKSWEMHSKDVLQRMYDYNLRSIKTLDEYIAAINNENYTVYAYKLDDSVDPQIEQAIAKSNSDTLNWSSIKAGNLVVLNGNEETIRYTEGIWTYSEKKDTNFLKISYTAPSQTSPQISSILWNNQEYIDSLGGYYIVVYDEFSNEFVSTTHIYMDADGNCILLQK